MPLDCVREREGGGENVFIFWSPEPRAMPGPTPLCTTKEMLAIKIEGGERGEGPQNLPGPTPVYNN